MLGLKVQRTIKGWTQEELAEKIECCQRHISRLEGGPPNKTIERLRRMRRVFGCTYEDLLEPDWATPTVADGEEAGA